MMWTGMKMVWWLQWYSSKLMVARQCCSCSSTCLTAANPTTRCWRYIFITFSNRKLFTIIIPVKWRRFIIIALSIVIIADVIIGTIFTTVITTIIVNCIAIMVAISVICIGRTSDGGGCWGSRWGHRNLNMGGAMILVRMRLHFTVWSKLDSTTTHVVRTCHRVMWKWWRWWLCGWLVLWCGTFLIHI